MGTASKAEMKSVLSQFIATGDLQLVNSESLSDAQRNLLETLRGIVPSEVFRQFYAGTMELFETLYGAGPDDSHRIMKARLQIRNEFVNELAGTKKLDKEAANTVCNLIGALAISTKALTDSDY